MAKFKTISSSDISTSKSFLNQLVDVIQEDISGSTTRQKYQVFVTGGVGPGVTSSLFHTVHDQDFTLQTANPVFDMTVGMFRDYVENGMPLSKTITDTSDPTMGTLPTPDSSGKLSFTQNSLMMREKINLYRQFAQLLLNDATEQFHAPFGDETDTSNKINNALFVCYKRLFARDSIKRETFAMKFYNGSTYVPALGSDTTIDTDGDETDDYAYADGSVDTFADATVADEGWYETETIGGLADDTAGAAAKVESTVAAHTNLNFTSENAVKIYTDVGSSTAKKGSYAGAVGDIVDASDTNTTVGTMFYDHGIAVFDMEKIMDCTQKVSGTISSVSDESTNSAAGAGWFTLAPADITALTDGFTIIGSEVADGSVGNGPDHCNPNATFVPDLMYSGSIDNILDHVGSCRFGSGTQSAMTFQNVTNINSSLIFCRATADEFNFSSNSSYTADDGSIVVIDESERGVQSSFTFVTSIGLYDSSNQLLAVAKLSRPVEKNNEKDMTFRIRLDFAKRQTNIRLNHRRN